MRVHKILSVLFALAAEVSANSVLSESVGPSPRESIDSSKGLVDITIRLRPVKHEDFETKLYSISNPLHEEYGKHLSREEAQKYLLPEPQAFDNVQKWLLAEGVSKQDIKREGSRLKVKAPSDVAESFISQHATLDKRSDFMERVPSDVRQYISAIERRSLPYHENTRRLASSNSHSILDDSIPAKRTSDGDVDLKKCKETLVPACIRKLYRMDKTPAEPHEKTLFGVPGFSNVSGTTGEVCDDG